MEALAIYRLLDCAPHKPPRRWNPPPDEIHLRPWPYGVNAGMGDEAPMGNGTPMIFDVTTEVMEMCWLEGR